MGSDEDLCCPILPGLLNTYRIKVKIFFLHSIGQMVASSTKRSCLARFEALEEIGLEGGMERLFKKCISKFFLFCVSSQQE